ncbi:adenosylmethionine decarboxylase [Rickettsiales bacterium LUAb2]
MEKLYLAEGGDTKELATPVLKDGVEFAGTHILIDLWGATNLNSPKDIEDMLIEAAKAAGATVLYSYMHPFEPHGVSGVVVLAESHISIHTWPERNYAALDVFMCGNADPYLTLPFLKDFFKPGNVQIAENKRGIKA